MSKEEKKEEQTISSSENENVSSEATNWKEIALALAKDLVEMSQSVRKVLSNSTFNYSIIDEVKLLEATTRDVINTYVEKQEEESDEEKENEA